MQEGQQPFGQKPGFSTRGVENIKIPNREYLDGQPVAVDVEWPKFATGADSTGEYQQAVSVAGDSC